jgi:hypothetical protein
MSEQVKATPSKDQIGRVAIHFWAKGMLWGCISTVLHAMNQVDVLMAQEAVMNAVPADKRSAIALGADDIRMRMKKLGDLLK